LAAVLEDNPDSKGRQVRDILGRPNLWREPALGALSMALRPVPVPFDAGLWGDRGRLRRLAEEGDLTAQPVLYLLTLARALRTGKDYAGAARLLRAAVRVRPQEVVLHYQLGKTLERQRPPRWSEAVECYAAARALRPELGQALANALVKSGRVEEGLALYKQLVTEQKDNPWLHLRRGKALAEQGNVEEAIACYRQAIKLDPKYAQAHYNLSNILKRQHRYKEAEAASREAIRLQPDSPEPHCSLGDALLPG
jgi:tetratricopeptide (TPR) repeat protein